MQRFSSSPPASPPPWDLPDWNAITNASIKGHEIGNHTMTHPDLSSETDAQVIEEESGAKSLIEAHTGKKCVSLAYPFCTVPKESITSQFCSFARSCNGLLVPSTPADFLNIGAMGPADMNAESDNAVNSGNWLVWLIHGIDDPNACCPIPAAMLRTNLDYVAPYPDKWWIDTFGNVCRYIKERDASVLTVISNGTTSITLQLTNNLDSTILTNDRVFNYPVTLRRPMPSGWNVAAITQNGVALSNQVVNGNLTFDVVPNGGDIVLAKLDTPLVLSSPAMIVSTNFCSYGDPATFTVTIRTNGIATGNAAGTVIIRDWGNPIGTNVVSAGQATLAISNLPVGAHAITAAYSGDSHYTASISGTLPFVVTPRPVALSGSKVYDGTTNISAANLVIANAVNGDEISLNGGGALASKDVGARAVATTTNMYLTPALVDWSWAGQNGWGLYAWFNTAPNFGNAMICVVATRNTVSNGFVNSVSFSDATNFTRVAQAVNAAGVTTEIWYNPNVYSTNHLLIVGLGNPNTNAVCIAAVYTNLPPLSALDQIAGAIGTGTAAVTGTTPTTTLANELWIGAIGYANTNTLTNVLNGFTEVAAQSSQAPATNGVDQVTLHFLQKVVTTTGAASSGGTIDTSQKWAGAIATFKAGTGLAGLSLGGPAAGNYTLTNATGAAIVTAKPLNFTGITANSRAYDGTSNATFTGSAAALTSEAPGLGAANDGKPYTGDSISLVTGALTGYFPDATVGTNKLVTLSGGISLSGAQASDYSIGSSIDSLTASILPGPTNFTLSSSFDGAKLNLNWPAGGVLLEAPTVQGPWTTNMTGGNFCSITPTGQMRFFRVLMPQN